MLGVMRARPGLHRLQRDGEKAHEVGIDQRRDAAGEEQAGVGADQLLPSSAASQWSRRVTGISTPTAITEPGTA